MFKVIATGSSGNCYLLQAGEDKLLLECGIGIKDILKGVGFNLNNIKGCLVTHSHKDHCKAFREVLRYGVDIYTGEGTVADLRLPSHHRIHYIKDKQKFEVGNFEILPFSVEHDTTEPLGFLIQHEEIGKVLFITDTSYLKYKFKNIDHIIIECSYSEELINDEELRVMKTHMSLETLTMTFKEWDLNGTKDITLIHLSSRYGDKELFRSKLEHLNIEINIPGKGEVIKWI